MQFGIGILIKRSMSKGGYTSCRFLVVEKYIDIFQKSGVKTEEIRKGRILGGVQGYLEGIFGDPSLTKIPGKT